MRRPIEALPDPPRAVAPPDVSAAAVARLADLRTELAEGNRALADLDADRERLVATLLRISGAVQVLEELLGAASASAEAAQGARRD